MINIFNIIKFRSYRHKKVYYIRLNSLQYLRRTSLWNMVLSTTIMDISLFVFVYSSFTIYLENSSNFFKNCIKILRLFRQELNSCQCLSFSILCFRVAASTTRILIVFIICKSPGIFSLTSHMPVHSISFLFQI